MVANICGAQIRGSRFTLDKLEEKDSVAGFLLSGGEETFLSVLAVVDYSHKGVIAYVVKCKKKKKS